MFAYASEKIQNAAEVISIVMIIFSIIIGVIVMAMGSFLLGLLYMIIGAFGAWIGGLLIYAFGEMTQAVSAIDYRNAEIVRILKTMCENEEGNTTTSSKTEHIEITPQARMARTGEGWVCRNCGEKNILTALSCRNCGRYK